MAVLVIFCFFLQDGMSQGYAWGVKGGLTIGFQKWKNFSARDPLYKYHADIFYESFNEDSPFSFFISGGYHIKGSAIRRHKTVVVNQHGTFDVPAYVDEYKFHNISVLIGAKQRYDFGSTSSAYYMIGLRGEYTITTELGKYEYDEDSPHTFYAISNPNKEFVKRWLLGATLGGGIEFPFSDTMDGFIEFSFSPDFTQQYFRPPFAYDNPITGNRVIASEEKVNNTVLEVSIGIKFNTIYDYIDDEDLEW